MILDAGVLISVERNEEAAQLFVAATLKKGTLLRVSAPVVAQVWRGGPDQHRLGEFVKTLEVHPFAAEHWNDVGRLLAAANTADVVDAHLVALAIKFDDSILTGDSGDLAKLVEPLPVGPAKPVVHAWP